MSDSIHNEIVVSLADKLLLATEYANKLHRLLVSANDELNEMTNLDCPEYVERDEKLESEIGEVLESYNKVRSNGFQS